MTRKLIWAERQERKHVLTVKRLHLLEIFSHTQQKLQKALITLLPSSPKSTPMPGPTHFSGIRQSAQPSPARPQLVLPEGGSHYLNGRFVLQAALMWGFVDITPGMSLVSSENNNQLAGHRRGIPENSFIQVFGEAMENLNSFLF